MPISRQKLQMSAFLASVFFIIATFVAVSKFVAVLYTGNLPITSIINVSADIMTLVLGYVLFICCSVDIPKNERNLNIYLLLLFTTFCAAFLDECAWVVDGDPSLIVWNRIINTLYYMATPCLAFLFWRYVITYLSIEHKALTKFDIGISIGLAASVLIILLNIIFGFFFYVDDSGAYSRGSLYILSNVYPYVTMILTLILVYMCRKRFKRYQVVTLFLYAFIPLIVGIFTVFTYGLSLSSPVIMMVLLLMYCVLNTVQSRENSISENELQMATTIQVNMLPHIFPPYPDRKEFDLYASMTPAREVGGDFYDFYLADDDHLVITIADVSGKGVPAALFMMVTKTLLKNRGLTDYMECSDMLSRVNDLLCDGNDLDMFVTAWVGVLTLSTGELRYANAGHEYPAIRKKGGGFTLIKGRHSPPLGAMEGIPYREQKLTMEPGDILYLYTDGVTEATDSSKKFFGEERLLEALNNPFDGTMKDLDENVRESIDAFIGGAPQFDDITMLCMKYIGPEKEK